MHTLHKNMALPLCAPCTLSDRCRESLTCDERGYCTPLPDKERPYDLPFICSEGAPFDCKYNMDCESGLCNAGYCIDPSEISKRCGACGDFGIVATASCVSVCKKIAQEYGIKPTECHRSRCCRYFGESDFCTTRGCPE